MKASKCSETSGALAPDVLHIDAEKEAKRLARNEYMKKWNAKNPDKVRNSRYKKAYGIDLAEYNRMLEVQNGVCALCLKSCHTGQNLAVDHCHTTGRVRGLLCHKCNSAVSRAKDSPIIVATAIQYLLTARTGRFIPDAKRLEQSKSRKARRTNAKLEKEQQEKSAEHQP